LKYDVIIAGASFAGLAVARELKGKILLIDKDEIGTHQTSACGTLVGTLEKFGCQDLVLQTFDPIFVNVAGQDIPLKFGYDFCTFNYPDLCRALLKYVDAEIVKAKVKAAKGNFVVTNKGDFEGRILVDATGWRGILARSALNNLNKEMIHINKKRLNFGFETVHPASNYEFNEKLKFYWNPNSLRKGITWIFPAGEEVRFGIGSYVGDTKLKLKLETFMNDFQLQTNNAFHGGYFTHKLREPTAGSIFLAGDSAGHCLPLTGEGIRPALYFGQKCGQVIRQIMKKEMTLENGLEQYRDFVLKHRQGYRGLYRLQKLFSNVPDFLTAKVLKYLSQPRIFPRLAKSYWDAVSFINKS